MAFVGDNGSGKSLAIKAVLKVFDTNYDPFPEFDISLTFNVNEEFVQGFSKLFRSKHRDKLNIQPSDEKQKAEMWRDLPSLTIRRYVENQRVTGSVAFHFGNAANNAVLEDDQFKRTGPPSDLRTYLSNIEGVFVMSCIDSIIETSLKRSLLPN